MPCDPLVSFFEKCLLIEPSNDGPYAIIFVFDLVKSKIRKPKIDIDKGVQTTHKITKKVPLINSKVNRSWKNRLDTTEMIEKYLFEAVRPDVVAEIIQGVSCVQPLPI